MNRFGYMMLVMSCHMSCYAATSSAFGTVIGYVIADIDTVTINTKDEGISYLLGSGGEDWPVANLSIRNDEAPYLKINSTYGDDSSSAKAYDGVSEYLVYTWDVETASNSSDFELGGANIAGTYSSGDWYSDAVVIPWGYTSTYNFLLGIHIEDADAASVGVGVYTDTVLIGTSGTGAP